MNEIATSFVVLQEARHAADYDWAFKTGRQDVQDLVRRAVLAASAARELANHPTYVLFLSLLLVGDKAARPR